MNKFRVGDIGVKFRFTVKDQDGNLINVSSLTTKTLFLTDPSGNVDNKALSYETDGSDSVLYYTTIGGDIDEIGIWIMQIYIQYSNGQEFTSDEHRFEVKRKLG